LAPEAVSVPLNQNGTYAQHGFIDNEWKGYNEAMVLLIMAIGSPTHPIKKEAWQQWCSTYTWEILRARKMFSLILCLDISIVMFGLISWNTR
jgi:hypothetical protein